MRFVQRTLSIFSKIISVSLFDISNIILESVVTLPLSLASISTVAVYFWILAWCLLFVVRCISQSIAEIPLEMLLTGASIILIIAGPWAFHTLNTILRALSFKSKFCSRYALNWSSERFYWITFLSASFW